MEKEKFFSYHEKASTKKPWLQYYSMKKEKLANTPYRRLSDHLENQSDNVVLHYCNRKITAEELFANILDVASALIVSGVKKGDVVAIAMPAIPEGIYLFYALNRIGAVAHIIDTKASTEEIKYDINEIKSRLLFTTEETASKWKEAIKQTTVEEVIITEVSESLPLVQKLKHQIKATLESKKEFEKSDFTKWRSFVGRNYQYHKMFETALFVHESYYEKDQIAMIVHTRKTKELPNRIQLTNDDINRITSDYMLAGFGFKAGGKVLNLIPPFTGIEIICGIHVPLMTGMKVVLVPDPHQVDRLFMKYRPDHTIGLLLHYQDLMKSEKLQNQNLSFLKSVIITGDEINPEVEKDLTQFLKRHLCSSSVKRRLEIPEAMTTLITPPNQYRKTESIGIPFPHNTIGIFEPNTEKELDYKEVGEICVQTSEHVQNVDNSIKQHQDGNSWLHSGNFGWINEDGLLFVKEKAERKIICHDGFYVYPKRIENAILKHQAVESCMVVGIDDLIHTSGSVPTAYITLKNEYPNIEKELEMLCKRLLPENSQPLEFEIREHLPLTETGEPDYHTLEIEALKRQKTSLLAVVKQIEYIKK